MTLINQLHVCILSLRESYGVLDDYISAANASNEVPKEINHLETDYNNLLSTIADFRKQKTGYLK
ncbi:MAG: hypothetical protein WDM90_20780 [Ferruginibacter sp.]